MQTEGDVMKIKDLLKEKEELCKITTLYTERLEEINKFLDEFLKNNKIYAPIEILKNYNDKQISKICSPAFFVNSILSLRVRLR